MNVHGYRSWNFFFLFVHFYFVFIIFYLFGSFFFPFCLMFFLLEAAYADFNFYIKTVIFFFFLLDIKMLKFFKLHWIMKTTNSKNYFLLGFQIFHWNLLVEKIKKYVSFISFIYFGWRDFLSNIVIRYLHKIEDIDLNSNFKNNFL